MLLDKDLAFILCQMDPRYKSYIRKDGKVLVKLKRALYGCVESVKLWYDTCRRGLEGLGYTANPYEPCVFNKTVDGCEVTIALYVDDLMVVCEDEQRLQEEIERLKGLYEGATVQYGHVHSYVGMTFDFSEGGRVHVRMEGSVKDMLKDYFHSPGGPSVWS